MFLLSLRNLTQHKFRLILSIGGVALAITLILLLNGFLAGIYTQVTAYLDNTPVDLVIAQDGVTNLLSATSLIPGNVENQIRGVHGIKRIIPIVSQFTILEIHDEKVVAYMVGYEPEQGGGPWKLTAGHPPEDDDEVVLDAVMAQMHGYRIGDSIRILSEDFTVVGLSDETNSWMASFFFVDKVAAERLLLAPGATSFLLLKLDSDTDPGIVVERLNRRLRNVEIVYASTMRQNDIDLLVKLFAAPLEIMVAIAFTVGTAILGMVIYTSTVERMKEYGVLKAVGARNHHLYTLVTQQALVIAMLGGGLGVALSWLAARWIMQSFPRFVIVLQPDFIWSTLLIGLAMGLFAALLPARFVARLDPARVFRK